MGSITVFATYSDREQLEAAIAVARSAGFRDSDVSVLVPASDGASDPADSEPGRGSSVRLGSDVIVTGGGVRSLVNAGTLMVPKVGPMLAAGPMLTALSKAQAETLVSDVTTWLIVLGVPAYKARRYDGLLQHGKLLAALHADNLAWVRKAMRIFGGTGAQNVSEVDEAKGVLAQVGKPELRRAS